jgi:hypothetical protein
VPNHLTLPESTVELLTVLLPIAPPVLELLYVVQLSAYTPDTPAITITSATTIDKNLPRFMFFPFDLCFYFC